jgi:hypothetical protein
MWLNYTRGLLQQARYQQIKLALLLLRECAVLTLASNDRLSSTCVWLRSSETDLTAAFSANQACVAPSQCPSVTKFGRDELLSAGRIWPKNFKDLLQCWHPSADDRRLLW